MRDFGPRSLAPGRDRRVSARLPGDDPWPPERVECLLALAADRCPARSATEIGAALGISRDAVIGKLSRLKVPLPGAVKARKPAAPKPSVPPPIELDPGLSPAVAAILALGPRSCRWPIGDPRVPGFRFCCAPRLVGSPYCAVHAVASAPRQGSAREAA